MVAAAARAVGCDPSLVLVASTGVIGMRLDVSKVTRGIAEAAEGLARDGHRSAAEAIMTTDRGPKERAVRVSTPSGTFSIGGMVKGAGMIEPNMATMLGFLTTDARLDPVTLRRALGEASDPTFNAITVDGEASTNDTVFLLAGGTSGVTIDAALYPVFSRTLRDLCADLAKDIVRGGEGATRLVEVRVVGARADDEARRAARLIANSLLVKTALHGGDPNWGRLLAVAGRAGVAFEEARARVRIGSAELFADATVFEDREAEAAAHLQAPEVEVTVDLGTGGERGGHRLDVRSQRGVRPHQRRLQDMTKPVAGSANLPATDRDAARAAGSLEGRCYLSVLDFQPGDLEHNLALAAALKRDRHLGREAATSAALEGTYLALLFEKPSLRTRSTFEIAIRELGGDFIDPDADVALGKRESLADVGRSLERWVAGGGGADLCAAPADGSRTRHDQLPRHQRPQRRGASLSGARRLPHVEGTLGRPPRAPGGVRGRRRECRDVVRAGRRDARHHRAHRVAGGLRASRVGGRRRRARRLRRRGAQALSRPRRRRARRRCGVHGRLDVDGTRGRGRAPAAPVRPVPGERRADGAGPARRLLPPLPARPPGRGGDGQRHGQLLRRSSSTRPRTACTPRRRCS